MRTFTKTINGKTVVREAATPAEAVRLEFDGWRERSTAKAAPKAGSKAAGDGDGAGATAGETPAGRAPAETPKSTGK